MNENLMKLINDSLFGLVLPKSSTSLIGPQVPTPCWMGFERIRRVKETILTGCRGIPCGSIKGFWGSLGGDWGLV